VAGERGYEATSIKLVSQRSGLPPSSIYWHFADKDALIAAVIDRSFQRWVEALDQPLGAPAGLDPEEVFRLALRRTGRALAAFPDFLRLGLTLVLDRRPDEPSARGRFIASRRATSARTLGFYRSFFPDLDDGQLRSLVGLTMALADGVFVAEQVDGDELDGAFDLMATAVLGVARTYRAAGATQGARKPNS
jgi:AcrR family transcriptional regulator